MNWDVQKELLKQPIPTYKQVVSMVERCDDERARALLAIAYLSGARVSEFQALRPMDLSLETLDNKRVLLFDLPNRKNIKQTRKNVPCSTDTEKRLVDIAIEWAGKVPYETNMWCVSIRRLQQVMFEHFGFNCHYMRHVRLTHLVTRYNFNAHELMKFAGWSDTRPSKWYVSLQWQDLVKKYEKRLV